MKKWWAKKHLFQCPKTWCLEIYKINMTISRKSSTANSDWISIHNLSIAPKENYQTLILEVRVAIVPYIPDITVPSLVKKTEITKHIILSTILCVLASRKWLLRKINRLWILLWILLPKKTSLLKNKTVIKNNKNRHSRESISISTTKMQLSNPLETYFLMKNQSKVIAESL